VEETPHVLEKLDGLATVLAEIQRRQMKEAYHGCREVLVAAIRGDSALLRAAGRVLWRYYFNYDEYEMVLLPVLYGTAVGEPAGVDVVRISPEDARGLIDERNPADGRRKLAGTAYSHFGAFLDRTWRHNDMLWGRLDGAERLIEALLPGEANRENREALIGDAHAAILREEFAAPGSEALRGQLCEALARRCAGVSGVKAIRRTLGAIDDTVFRKALEDLVGACLRTDADLLQHFRTNYEVNRQLEPTPVLRLASRATQVIGRMLELLANGNGKRDRSKGGPLTWVARLGRTFWGLIEVAVPDSLLNLIWRHWRKVLYVCEALLIVGGMLFYRPVLAFGVGALLVTLVLHALVYLLGDLMRGGGWLRRLAWIVPVAFVAGLAGLGVLDILNVSGAINGRPLKCLVDGVDWLWKKLPLLVNSADDSPKTP
jgi:hypothetical protein